MLWKRSAGVLPATGTVLPIVFLMAGMSPAHADEIADLRANQQLLQQRIDQLAQATTGAANPGAGTYIAPGAANPGAQAPSLGGSFPRSFLIPGTDTSIRIGGVITEEADYYLSGGNPNTAPQSTTIGNGGAVPVAALDIHGQFVPGFTPSTAAAGQALAAGSSAFFPAVSFNHSRGNGVFLMSPRTSKFNIETRMPTPYGEARTFIELDFTGSTNFSPSGTDNVGQTLHDVDSLVPRLRYAYGTLGGFLAGQANSNFADPDANAEALEIGGNVGEPGPVRIPQVRYTIPITWGWGGAFSVSAEAPETDLVTPTGFVSSDNSGSNNLPTGPGLNGAFGGVCTGTATVAGTACSTGTLVQGFNPAKAGAPDLTFAYYVPQPWGHLDFSAVFRPAMELADGGFVNRWYQGYGGHFGFDVKPGWFGWKKDDITFHVLAGDGIGRYLSIPTSEAIATNYLSHPASLAAANNVIASTIVGFGGEAGYQHWWADNLRSTVSAGIAHSDARSNLMAPPEDQTYNKELITAHANLIWSPVAFVDFGVEYLYGHRVTTANLKGDVNTVIGRFNLRF